VKQQLIDWETSSSSSLSSAAAATVYTGVLISPYPTRKETNYSDRRFWCSYILFIIITGGILVLFIYITKLASNEIFSPSNKIHREVGRAKDLSAPPATHPHSFRLYGCWSRHLFLDRCTLHLPVGVNQYINFGMRLSLINVPPNCVCNQQYFHINCIYVSALARRHKCLRMRIRVKENRVIKIGSDHKKNIGQSSKLLYSHWSLKSRGSQMPIRNSRYTNGVQLFINRGTAS